jgi:hypothetical protein
LINSEGSNINSRPLSDFAPEPFRQHRLQLSVNDCFAWRLAEVHQGILMTGDADLRELAGQSGVEVHGVLWAIELMSRHATCRTKQLINALDQLDGDPMVRLPKKSLRTLRDKIRGSSKG